MNLSVNLIRTAAIVLACTASLQATVLLSEDFSSSGTALPPNWFSAVAAGAGTPFSKGTGYSMAAGFLNSKSEVQLYSPLLTLSGLYPLTIRFSYNTVPGQIAFVFEVSVNGGAYVDFASAGTYSSGPPTFPLSSGYPNVDGQSGRQGFSNNNFPDGLNAVVGQIASGPVAPHTTYQFRWRLGTLGPGNPGEGPTLAGAITNVSVTSTDPVSPTPESGTSLLAAAGLAGLAVVRAASGRACVTERKESSAAS